MLWILQILLIIFLIALGGFFAGSETGVYRLSRFRLRLGIQQKKRFYHTLGTIIHDGHGLVLAVLIGNNLTNYLVTSITTFMIFMNIHSERTAELYATIVLTPVLFVFVDIIPKSIFYYRSDVLMPKLAPVLRLFYRIFTYSGAVRALKFITHVLNNLFGSHSDTSTAITTTGRHLLEKLIEETRDEGLLSPVLKDIMYHMVNAPSTVVRQVMIPIARVDMVDIKTDRTALLTKLGTSPHTRLAVYCNQPDNITGFINICRTLAKDTDFRSLDEMAVAPIAIGDDCSVLEAINIMRKNNGKIALVVHKSGHQNPKTCGIVTLKDLVENLTGALAQH